MFLEMLFGEAYFGKVSEDAFWRSFLEKVSGAAVWRCFMEKQFGDGFEKLSEKVI